MQVLYMAMALLLAAANWCPPLLKQQSLQAFMGNSASSLLAATAGLTVLNSSELETLRPFTPNSSSSKRLGCCSEMCLVRLA